MLLHTQKPMTPAQLSHIPHLEFDVRRTSIPKVSLELGS